MSTTNTELIARLKDADAEEVMTTPLCEDAADAIEALESQRDDLRSQVDSLNVGFNNCQTERDAFLDERNRLNQLWGDAQAQLAAAQTEVERLTMALHGYQVAIETAEESLKDRVALAMEVDRLSAAGASHCGHRPPCIECSKYAAPIPQQVATAQEILPVDLRIDMWPPAPTSGMVVGMSKGVMITHISTGIEVICDTERSQHRNRDAAFEQLKKKLAAAPQPKETK